MTGRAERVAGATEAEADAVEAGDAASRRRSDGARTHAAILDEAVRLASIEGIGSLTIGRLAAELGVSKSGVFAHFRSKQRLQEETMAEAAAIFEREVVAPAMASAAGLARLAGLCEAYLAYLERGVFPGGCFFAHLLAELDAVDGPLHDAMVAGQRRWIGLIEEEAAEARRRGEILPGVEPVQLAFELYAPLELANFLATLDRDPAIIDRGRAAVGATIARARG